MTEHIAVRPARPEDRPVVLAFCQSTWEWGDYIEQVWEEWLHDDNGQLLVATIDGTIGGIAHMTMLTNEDAWFEGLRVDPHYRRQGVARVLYEALLLEAMHRKATRVRLAIESTNQRSIEITEHGHWQRVGEFALYTSTLQDSSPMRPLGGDRPLQASPQDLDPIIDFLNVSNIFPLTGGLYYAGFKAYPITEALLREKIAAGQLYVLYRWDRLDGLAITEEREGYAGKRLSVGYIDGTAIEAISLLAYTLRFNAYERKLPSIRVFAPNLIFVHDAFTGVGYEGEQGIFYTYERGLV